MEDTPLSDWIRLLVIHRLHAELQLFHFGYESTLAETKIKTMVVSQNNFKAGSIISKLTFQVKKMSGSA